MTIAEPARRVRPRRVHVAPGSRVVRWITTTDHKVIGYLYLSTSFVFFLVAGIMAELMRDRAGPARACSCSRTSSTTSCSRCTAR